MILGFDKSSTVKTLNGEVEISSIGAGDMIFGLLNSDDLIEIQVSGVVQFNSRQCLKITLSGQRVLICSSFISVFSISEKTFISAHRLRKGDYIKGVEGDYCVTNLELINNNDLTSVHFVEKASFFVNDVLCHSLLEPSSYALFRHGDVNYSQTKINQLSLLIYPEHKYNKTLVVSWRYSSGKNWRKAQNIVHYSFEENQKGYTFGKDSNSLKIQLYLDKESSEYKFVLINAFGKDVSVDTICEKYEVNNSSLFIVDLNNFELKAKNAHIELALNSENGGILCNCVLINESEYRNIVTYYQGNLVKK